MSLEFEWNPQISGDELPRRNRIPLMRPVSYERTEAFSEAGGLEGREGRNETALSINVSNGGMCLLMDWEPNIQDVLRVHVPMPVILAKKIGRASCRERV